MLSALNRVERAKEGESESHKMLESQFIEAKKFHIRHYEKMEENVKKDINKQLDGMKSHINYTIADFTTHSFILAKLLTDKKVIELPVLLEYIEKYHDKYVKDSIKSKNQPQKKLELGFKENVIYDE